MALQLYLEQKAQAPAASCPIAAPPTNKRVISLAPERARVDMRRSAQYLPMPGLEDDPHEGRLCITSDPTCASTVSFRSGTFACAGTQSRFRAAVRSLLASDVGQAPRCLRPHAAKIRRILAAGSR